METVAAAAAPANAPSQQVKHPFPLPALRLGALAPGRDHPQRNQAMIDDQLEQMRNQLTHGHEHAQHQQAAAHGQELAGDAPGGQTWVEFIQNQPKSPADNSTLERLRSLPDEQQQQRQEQEQDRGRGR